MLREGDLLSACGQASSCVLGCFGAKSVSLCCSLCISGLNQTSGSGVTSLYGGRTFSSKIHGTAASKKSMSPFRFKHVHSFCHRQGLCTLSLKHICNHGLSDQWQQRYFYKIIIFWDVRHCFSIVYMRNPGLG